MSQLLPEETLIKYRGLSVSLRRLTFPLLAVLSIALSCTPVQAATPPDFEYLAHHEGSSLSAVRASDDWQAGRGIASFGFRNQPFWLRWQVPADRPADVFVVQNAWLHEFELYLLGDGEVVSSYLTGGSHLLDSRAVQHPEYTFPLSADPPVQEIYVLNRSPLNAVLYPVAFMSWSDLAGYTARLHGLHGIYYGVLLIMLIYNLAIFISVRDRAYLYLVGYGASLMTLIAASDGFGQTYVWGSFASAQLTLTTLAIGAVPVMLGQFCLHFLDIDRRARVVYRSIRTLQLAAAINSLSLLLFGDAFTVLLEPLILLAGSGLFLIVGVWKSLQGSAPARLFLVANGIFCATGAMVALTHLGWIPATRFGMQAAMLGSCIEFALLSLALGWRMKRQQHLQQRLTERSQGLSRRVRELRAASGLAEEHRQLQRAMQHAQKLKTIGQMAGGIAHDFNNILATILGFTELALDPPAQADRHRLGRYLTEIRQAGERGATLVRQLLTYSRSSRTDRSRLDLSLALEETISLLRGSLPATVTIASDLPRQRLFSQVDAAQLQQVLVNVCLNSSEAMRNRGTISIGLEERSVRNLQCSSCLARFDGHYAAITVADTGVGIQVPVQDAFTPFHTTKPVGQGSGLGLSVVHGITHEHGGHLHLANRAEGGSRFSCYLPLRAEEEERSASTAPRVLLLEDDPAVGRYLETLLAEHDYQVTLTRLPTDALEAFIARPDTFDLVIANQLLPDGTGMEIARDMLALRPDLPVILTTGNPAQIGADELLVSGVRAVFAKPIESELLLAKMAGLLKNGATQ